MIVKTYKEYIELTKGKSETRAALSVNDGRNDVFVGITKTQVKDWYDLGFEIDFDTDTVKDRWYINNIIKID